MSDEERIRNSSCSSSVSFRNGGGNGRSSKKPKPKKIPQRGLGVAQLEKIRLEEGVKNEAQNLPSGPAPAAVAPHPATGAAGLYNRPLSLPPFAPYPFSNDSLYRHHGIGALVPGTQLSNSGGLGISYQSAIFTEGPASNSLSSEYLGEMEKAALSLTPSCEPGFTGSFRGTAHRGNQQSSLYSSSMVNAVAGNSSSAVFNFQTEPPSNQSPYGTFQPVQPNETEKIVGTKRPCPFSLQNPLLHGKINPLTSHGPLGRSTSYGNPGSFAINRNFGDKEGLPGSMPMPELRRMNDSRPDCARPDGDFLKLAPPAFATSKAKPPLSYPDTHHAGLLELNSTHSPAVQAQASSAASEPNCSFRHHHDQLQFHSFFPAPNNVPADASSRQKGEDHVDLNLKL